MGWSVYASLDVHAQICSNFKRPLTLSWTNFYQFFSVSARSFASNGVNIVAPRRTSSGPSANRARKITPVWFVRTTVNARERETRRARANAFAIWDTRGPTVENATKTILWIKIRRSVKSAPPLARYFHTTWMIKRTLKKSSENLEPVFVNFRNVQGATIRPESWSL